MDKLNCKWLPLLSKYRGEIMGSAAVLIMLFHFVACLYDNLKIPVVTAVLSHGNTGVDIFLFLSGIGLYASLLHDGRTLPFYRKRISRVVIPALLISLPYWFCTDFLFKRNGPGMFLLDWSFLSFWTHGNRTVWYVSLIVLLYLLYPPIFRMQKKRSAYIVLLMLAVTAAVTALFVLAPEIYQIHEIASTRIPVFLAGSLTGEMLFAEDAEKHRNAPAVTLYTVLSLALFVTAFVISKAYPDTAEMLYRFGCGGAGIILSLLTALLLEKFPCTRVQHCLKTAGGISLELYLVHIFIKNLLTAARIGQKSGAAVQLGIIAAAMAVSLLLSLGIGKLEQRIRRAKKQKQDTD